MNMTAALRDADRLVQRLEALPASERAHLLAELDDYVTEHAAGSIAMTLQRPPAQPVIRWRWGLERAAGVGLVLPVIAFQLGALLLLAYVVGDLLRSVP